MRLAVRTSIAALTVAATCLLGAVAMTGSAFAQAKQQPAPAKQQAAPPKQAVAPEPPPPLKQIELTDKQIESLIAAQKEMDAVTEKLPQGAADKPDPKLQAQLEGIAKKNGFADFNDYGAVYDNVSLVMSGIDPKTKAFTEPPEMLRKQIAAVQADARSLATERIVIEEFLEGSEYCVEYFDGRYVGALRKLKRHGAGFLERGYTSELDLDANTLRALIDVGTRATAAAGLTWGPVHLDCIVHDGVPHVIELNPRIAGSFICDIVRDGYGFNVVEALLDRLDGKTVTIPELFEPHAYARAEFLLDSDPGAWRFAQAGEIDDGAVRISYGPQVLPDRERRAFLYVRVALPAVRGAEDDAGSTAEHGAVVEPTLATAPSPDLKPSTGEMA